MFTPGRLFMVLMTGMLISCVSMPIGPSVMTLPGSGKSFEQFRADDYECREYAFQQIGGRTPQQSIQTSGVESAAVGAGLGAAAGAALAGGQGAAIGAGTGLLLGSAVGSGTATTS
ncbi:MAG: glycine zipper family protein, partial [Nitrosomonas sp.]|nr:glycine zipper family protein [Nitrosomonas sp.]